MENIFHTPLDDLQRFFESLNVKTERITDNNSDLLEVTTPAEILSIYTEEINGKKMQGWHVAKPEETIVETTNN